MQQVLSASLSTVSEEVAPLTRVQVPQATKPLLALVEATRSWNSPTVPERYLNVVGLLRVRADEGIMKALESKCARIEKAIAYTCAVPALGLGVLVATLAFDSPNGISNVIVRAVLCTLLLLIVSSTSWLMAFVAVLWGIWERCPLPKALGATQNAGWDMTVLSACKRMSVLGMPLPPALLSLVPRIKEGEASPTVMRLLGEDDSVAMFLLADTLSKVADAAEQAKLNLHPVQGLTLRGESAELLCRVGTALGLDEDAPTSSTFLV